MTDLADYIPHKPPMRLVEQIVSVNSERVVTEAEIGPDNVFYDSEQAGVPAWVGLEYMAQTAAVWVGNECLRAGKAIEPAFLISSRHYSAEVPVFPRGETLRVTVTPDLIEGPLVAFAGEVHNSRGERLVEAIFTAFQPDDVNAYLQASEPLAKDKLGSDQHWGQIK